MEGETDMPGVQRVIVVGCGHMGFAIVQGLLGEEAGREIVVVENSSERRAVLSAHGGFAVRADLEIAAGDLVILAIPPQLFSEFAEAQQGVFLSQTPVVSVMAGLTAGSIAAALGTQQVIRAIPNTPSEVFEGMSVYYADSAVSKGTVAAAEALLRSIGRVLRVNTEELVDDATAICGGGPAFVSYIVDAFCQFAVSRGFSAGASREMAVQVFRGTASLIDGSGKTPMQLFHEVMTPNGTTERGIAAFDEVDLKSAIRAALTASAQRSRELAFGLNAGAVSGEFNG